MRKISDKISDYKSLRDYTDDELMYYLDNNMTIDVQVLAGICSEVLRRKLIDRITNKDNPKSYDD